MSVEWISVEDRLPNDTRLVIAAIESCVEEKNTIVEPMFYRKDKDAWYTAQGYRLNTDRCRVYKWMPLPDPPAGE